MNEIDEYINNQEETRKSKIRLVVDYIRNNYSAEESMDYGEKTKIPMFKVKGVYVAIANMKNYITIHFGKYDATEIIIKNNSKIVSRVGCVNIKDNIQFPIDDIKLAIDYCYK